MTLQVHYKWGLLLDYQQDRLKDHTGQRLGDFVDATET